MYILIKLFHLNIFLYGYMSVNYHGCNKTYIVLNQAENAASDILFAIRIWWTNRSIYSFCVFIIPRVRFTWKWNQIKLINMESFDTLSTRKHYWNLRTCHFATHALLIFKFHFCVIRVWNSLKVTFTFRMLTLRLFSTESNTPIHP